MISLFVFAITLLLAVLVSELAERSVLSTAVLFLAAGFLAGEGVLNVVQIRPDNPVVSMFAELALFSVLFTDGMRISVRDLVTAWSLPGRALLMGLPLTLLGTALLGRWVVGLPWADAFLLGAALSPTDPVFASAIVGRDEVPFRLRHLLNVESGLNDGLSLPIVLAMLAVVESSPLHLGEVLYELVLGLILGVVVPWSLIRLEQTRFFAAHQTYQPLFGLAIGLLVLSLSAITRANAFLAAFAAGITVASVSPEVKARFQHFGELIAELLKLAALMVFGALISPRFLSEISLSGYVFVLLALVAVRPIAIGLSLVRSPLGVRERVAAAWFGPKGFASVVFGLLILKEGAKPDFEWARADQLYHLIALTITGSILAHSSTDVIVARWFREKAGDGDRRAESLE